MNPSEYEITNGYIGSFGKSYTTATEKTLAETIAAAATFNNKPENEIAQLLEGGTLIQWCKSPNYYYDHSHGVIRRKQAAEPVAMKKCSCGHTIPATQAMMASLGSSCPNCYDRMSG